MLDRAGRVLLFRFVPKLGASAGRSFWATPGGGVEPGETFEQAAIRELEEETGFRVDSVGPEIARREFPLELLSGEPVWAEERYFRIDAAEQPLSRTGWTSEEQEFMTEHRWWSKQDLAETSETFWPKDLADLMDMEAPRRL